MIRKVREADLETLKILNEAAVPHVNSISIDEFKWFKENATFFWVVEQGDELVGFLIVLGPGLSYESVNYSWFNNSYSTFAYVDRIVISEKVWGKGLGKALYQRLFEEAVSSTDKVTCEVNIKPVNTRSLEFHGTLGFEQVGEQDSEGGKKRVRLLMKKLNKSE